METRTKRIWRRMTQEGWKLDRCGGGHDIYRHPVIPGIITLPRHNIVSPGVARSIAKKAGWTED